MHRVYLALGSNIGDRNYYLNSAIEKLSTYFKINKVSSFLKNPSYGPIKQDDFLNAVIEIETDLDPIKVLKICNKIEEELDRVRTIRWGARTIDIDILFYDDLIIKSKNLTIPHYDMLNRDFVLIPFCEINPNFIHPIEKKSMKDLLKELKLT